MTDRESIVAMLRKQAKEAHELATKPCDADGRLSLLSLVAAAETFADQIERGEDLEPAKPKATIADLLTLHDLDLGALARKVGLREMRGDCRFTTKQAEMLCGGFKVSDDERYDLVEEAERDSEWSRLEACRQIATLGAKVRAALSAPTIEVASGFKTPTYAEISDYMRSLANREVQRVAAKVATPRVLRSADEAPCGSLMQCNNGAVLLRLWDGTGWRVGFTGALHKHACGWMWADSRGRVSGARLIAEGLTEAECRHLSGLSAADAVAWCRAR